MAPDHGLFTVLNRHGVPFVVIGGHAVCAHGFVRGTEDTDVIWIRSAANEAALLRALEELHAQYIGSEIDPATGIERTHPVNAGFLRSQHLMMLVTDAGFLDLFDYVPSLPDVSVTAVFESAIDVDGVRFASLGWLRRMKTASGRPQDLLDLERLPDA
jgi:hypothetical protein